MFYEITLNYLKDHLLQALQYIPNILSLQRTLMLKYNRKVDKAEANSQITVGSLLEGLFFPVTLETSVI